MFSTARLIFVLAVSVAAGAPARLGGQGSPTRVEYDVEFSVVGSLLDANCAASGSDVLKGTLVGFEPPPRNEPSVYVGKLLRSTGINICGSRRNATTGTDVVCSMSITGDDVVDVSLTIEPGQREGYLQYLSSVAQYRSLLALRAPPQPPAPHRVPRVTGTCDPPEMAQMQSDWHLGQTGGSPSGQPIEVPSLPPASVPHTFAPNPPVSIWTLKVLARRP